MAMSGSTDIGDLPGLPRRLTPAPSQFSTRSEPRATARACDACSTWPAPRYLGTGAARERLCEDCYRARVDVDV